MTLEPGMTLPSGMGAMTPAASLQSPPSGRIGIGGMIHG